MGAKIQGKKAQRRHKGRKATRKTIFMPAWVLLSPSVVSLTSGFRTIFGRNSELRTLNQEPGNQNQEFKTPFSGARATKMRLLPTGSKAHPFPVN
jgi:hypothetical protein